MNKPNNDEMDILWQCLIYGGAGSIAGVAALLRTNEPLDRRAFWAAVLNSGMFSIAAGIGIVWNYGEQHFLLAVTLSILSGLGGNALIDFMFGLAKLYFKKKLRHDEDNRGQ
tara:strand:- start:954 stop:1289 length:336 start_codon:yes stop_codon:yes gene_type:complete